MGSEMCIRDRATGGVNIPGVLTYEDVTNVDSVGVITARSGIKIGATGANTLISGTATGIGIGTDSPGSPLEVNGGTSVDTATFNSHNANGVLINLQRSGSSKGFLGSGKNIADATGGVDDIGLRSQANLIFTACLLYTSPSPRDGLLSRMPSSA